MQDGEKIDWKELPTGSYIRQLKGQVHRWSEKYTSGNAKSNESFTIPAKVLAIRPNTRERSAILELCDGRTTIRDRLHCCIDPTQPQPDTIDNIEECDANYLKFITKPQVSNKDEQQIIDTMMQKMKAKREEVQLIAGIGRSILVEVTSQFQPHSCIKKTNSRSPKHVRFNFQEREE